MKPNKLSYFKKILLEKRNSTIESIEKLRESSRMYDELFEGRGNYSYFNSEEGGDFVDREQIFLFMSRELKYLQQIEYALSLIERGDYGICYECGNEISHERLEAVPTTQICVACKRKQSLNLNFN